MCVHVRVVYCILEALESHGDKNSTGGGAKTQDDLI